MVSGFRVASYFAYMYSVSQISGPQIGNTLVYRVLVQ